MHEVWEEEWARGWVRFSIQGAFSNLRFQCDDAKSKYCGKSLIHLILLVFSHFFCQFHTAFCPTKGRCWPYFLLVTVCTKVRWVNCRLKAWVHLELPVHWKRPNCDKKRQRLPASVEPTPGELVAGSLFLVFRTLWALPSLPTFCPTFSLPQHTRWATQFKTLQKFSPGRFRRWIGFGCLILAYLVWLSFSGMRLQQACWTYHHVAPSPNQLLPTTGQYCKLFTPSARQQGGHSFSQHQQKSCMNFTTSIKFHLFFVYFCSESSNILWQCCSLKVSFVMRWKFWINLMIFKDCEYPLSPFLSLSPNCQSNCGNQWDLKWHNAENVWDNRRRGLKRWIAKYGQRASPSLSVLFCHNISAAIVLQLLLRVQPVQCPPWTNTMKPACLQTESRCH